MSRKHPSCGAKQNCFYAALSTPLFRAIHQALRDAECLPAKVGMNKHLLERNLLIADINDTDGTNDFARAQRNPEVTVSFLENVFYIDQIRLLITRNLDAEFNLLNRQDQFLDGLLVARLEFDDFNFLFHNNLHDTFTDYTEYVLIVPIAIDNVQYLE